VFNGATSWGSDTTPPVTTFTQTRTLQAGDVGAASLTAVAKDTYNQTKTSDAVAGTIYSSTWGLTTATELWAPHKYATDIVYGASPVIADILGHVAGATNQLVAAGTPSWSATGWDATRGAAVCNGSTDYFTADALAAAMTGTAAWVLLLAMIIPAPTANTQALWSGASDGGDVLFMYPGTGEMTVIADNGGSSGAAPATGRSIICLRKTATKCEVRQLQATETTLIAEFNSGSMTLNQCWLLGYDPANKKPIATSLRCAALLLGTFTQVAASAEMVKMRDNLDCPLA
jgi:hypothetical protein